MRIYSTVPNQFSELKSDGADRRGKALNNLYEFSPKSFYLGLPYSMSQL